MPSPRKCSVRLTFFPARGLTCRLAARAWPVPARLPARVRRAPDRTAATLDVEAGSLAARPQARRARWAQRPKPADGSGPRPEQRRALRAPARRKRACAALRPAAPHAQEQRRQMYAIGSATLRVRQRRDAVLAHAAPQGCVAGCQLGARARCAQAARGGLDAVAGCGAAHARAAAAAKASLPPPVGHRRSMRSPARAKRQGPRLRAAPRRPAPRVPARHPRTPPARAHHAANAGTPPPRRGV